MSESLWGELPKPEKIRTPVFLLREQADILTKATAGIIEGRVMSQQLLGRGAQGSLEHRLILIAPALNRYTLQILTVTHDIMIYPTLVVNSLTEIGYQCADEEQFQKVLRTILSSDEVHKALAGLLAQSRDLTSSK